MEKVWNRTWAEDSEGTRMTKERGRTNKTSGKTKSILMGDGIRTGGCDRRDEGTVERILGNQKKIN